MTETTDRTSRSKGLVARVLFVDDEKFVLEAIRRTIRNTFDLTLAEGGEAALEILHSDVEPFDVICTDMRMPNVDGVAVLKAFREHWPDTTRVLLTGQTDLEAAVAAVNEGSVFRFLLKPTNPDELRSAIAEAVELRQLRNSEKELLEQTLRGSVQALLETLALANPLVFARAQRVRTFVMELVEHTDLGARWEIEIAAMLSQVGAVTLPVSVSERLHRGLPLDRSDSEMVAELPLIADRLLADIPRLENVRHTIRSLKSWTLADTPTETKLLQMAADLDALTERGLDPDVISASIHEHAASYGAPAVAAFDSLRSNAPATREVLHLPVIELMPGMVLAADVRTKDGLLLVGRGQEVTGGLLTRIQNFSQEAGLEDDNLPVYAAPVETAETAETATEEPAEQVDA